jgi:hypothetical protein
MAQHPRRQTTFVQLFLQMKAKKKIPEASTGLRDLTFYHPEGGIEVAKMLMR